MCVMTPVCVAFIGYMEGWIDRWPLVVPGLAALRQGLRGRVPS